jgi:hypothetical protein
MAAVGGLRDSSDTKENTVVLHHKMSMRDRIQRITNLKLFLHLFKIYYQLMRTGR